MMNISIVIPVFNESDAIEYHLPIIIDELKKINDCNFQVIVVNDGSIDDTSEKVSLLCEKYSFLELISFTRNFGKEAAVHAGLVYASGDAVIVMDSDLQHPPSLIAEMLSLWKSGVHVVDACKISRGEESLLSKFLSQGFYYIFKKLTRIDIKE